MTGDFMVAERCSICYKWYRMNAMECHSEVQQVAELAQRIQQLEGELSSARAQLVGMHSRLLFNRQFFYADSDMQNTLRSAPVTSCSHRVMVAEDSPAITIEPLPIQHPLRRKWALGKGLPERVDAEAEHHLCFTEDRIPSGHLRLFCLLSDGEVWDELIPFSQLVQEGGVVLGRDAELVDYCIPEQGISRKHARVELGSTGLVISDMNSTNGLLVNDQYVNAYSPRVPMPDGSIIRLGNTAIRVEIVYGTAESAH